MTHRDIQKKYIYNESITFGRQNQFLNKLPFGLSGYIVLQSLSPESVSFIYGDSCHQTQHLRQRSGNAQPAASLPLLASLCFLWSLHHMSFSADPLNSLQFHLQRLLCIGYTSNFLSPNNTELLDVINHIIQPTLPLLGTSDHLHDLWLLVKLNH